MVIPLKKFSIGWPGEFQSSLNDTSEHEYKDWNNLCFQAVSAGHGILCIQIDPSRLVSRSISLLCFLAKNGGKIQVNPFRGEIVHLLVFQKV